MLTDCFKRNMCAQCAVAVSCLDKQNISCSGIWPCLAGMHYLMILTVSCWNALPHDIDL